ncbi:MAG TPA: EpsI family protein [Verrucomicrobiae bacterium]|nr:EpsI family protein [Verrucomicrobiae bacterium]
MLKNGKAFLLVLIYLGALSAFRLTPPAAFSISASMSPFFQTFPKEIGAWKGEDTPPDQRTLEILETRNVLSRNYQNAEGKKLHLLLVSSEKDRRVAHPPEVCYLGANFNIVDDVESKFSTPETGTIGIRQFRAVNERHPDDQQQVLYLYKIGNRFTTNYYAQQLQFALDRISRKETEVMLIRLAGADAQDLKAFLQDLLPYLTGARQPA